MNIKQSTNDDASAQKLNITMMKEIEDRVQTSFMKKFAIIDDKTDKVLELFDKLEQTTCTKLNEIKSLLYQVRNESRTCTSQQTQTMPVASEYDKERVELHIAKSFDLETKRSQPTKAMPNPPTKHGQPSSSAFDGETKGKLAGPQLIKSSDCAKKSEPTKTMLQKPHRTLDALSVASHSLDQSNESRFDKSSASKPSLPLTSSETSSTSSVLDIEQSLPSSGLKPSLPLTSSETSSTSSVLDTEQSLPSSGLKPSLLHALKPKTMPQAAATTAAPVKSISVASIKENRRQILNERINESSESSLTVSKHQNTNGTPQQKSQEVVADLSICHPELLDLSESNTSTFFKSSEITGTQQKLIDDIQNKTANEYLLPSNLVKKDDYNSVLSSSKPEPYEGLFDFSTLKFTATSTPVRRTRPVPPPRSESKNSSVTNINVPSINQ
uniref:Uncharacterized protein n=1 Tax=Panagrolaimus davidi TaxID=227884 RepID=A0A914QYE0_9BILA